MTDSTSTAIERFFSAFEGLHPPGRPAVIDFDPDWPSPCEIGTAWVPEDAETSQIRWQPVRREGPIRDFAGLEDALELEIHPAVKAHYGTFWSGHINATAPDGDLCLLYLWSEQDADRLIENLIGHAVACRRTRTPFAVFFALTDPDGDYFLTIHNETGAVQLEAPGRKALRTVAGSLAEFMDTLTPRGAYPGR